MIIPRLLRRLADWMDPPKKPEAREPKWAPADSLRTIIERRTIMLRAGTPSADWSGVEMPTPNLVLRRRRAHAPRPAQGGGPT